MRRGGGISVTKRVGGRRRGRGGGGGIGGSKGRQRRPCQFWDGERARVDKQERTRKGKREGRREGRKKGDKEGDKEGEKEGEAERVDKLCRRPEAEAVSQRHSGYFHDLSPSFLGRQICGRKGFVFS